MVYFSSHFTFYHSERKILAYFVPFRSLCRDFMHIVVCFLQAQTMRWCTKIYKYKVWVLSATRWQKSRKNFDSRVDSYLAWSSSLKIAVVHDVCGCWLVCGVGEKEVRVVALVLQIFPMIDRHVSSCLSSTWSTWKQFHRLMKSASCALDALNHLRILSPTPSWLWQRQKWGEMLSNL